MEDRTLPSAMFPEFVDPNPSDGNGFGDSVVPLNTGNVVITAPFDDAGGTDAGAVYLYNGATGELISTLIGASDYSNVGSAGVTALSNGNFVVCSPYWNSETTNEVGAVTFGDGTNGINGVVSAANSLVGSSEDDHIGIYNYDTPGVTALTNGNYVVTSSTWDNGSIYEAGAVTFGNGTTGVTGVVSATNSLVGSAENDRVGLNGVTGLNNGNYVVNSPYWKNGTVVYAGAVTFGDGTSGVSGEVSASNSLVGGRLDDRVGFDGVTALTNGNYVVGSSLWTNNNSKNAAGAVTFGDGNTGVTGEISSDNSLVGSNSGDNLGSGGVTALTNGNYVVNSPDWFDPTDPNPNGGFNAGAVTFGNGNTGVKGGISAANSLIGRINSDRVGSGGVVALSNGNYVVSSPTYSPLLDAYGNVAVSGGAVTFGDGNTGVIGVVSVANSLVGTTTWDTVGTFVTALANGNYVVSSPQWDNGTITDAGAVTFGDGTTGISGVASAANSLVGSTENDTVGVIDTYGPSGVTALTNGNYVVCSPRWDSGTTLDAGAVTYGDGTSGITGAVSAANSLIGSTDDDQVGLDGVTALANGNYVVRSSAWNNGSTPSAGAVTFGNGTTGITGAVSASNSLVGSTADDQAGVDGVTALANGNYVVDSSQWDNGAVGDAGAVTFGDGTTGVNGNISASNSLVGGSEGDHAGYSDNGTSAVATLSNGNYVVTSTEWDNGQTTDSGAVTFGDGISGVSGIISTANSVTGTQGSSIIPEIVSDDVNNSFYVSYLNEGKVWVLPQEDAYYSITLDEISDVIINKNATEQMVSLTGITTSGFVANSLRVTATSNNTNLIPDPIVAYDSPNTSGSLTFTPAADQSGIATITVTVEDGGLDGDLNTSDDNNLLQRTFDVTVSNLEGLIEFVDPNPSDGNGFGDSVVPLNTGNVVITAPFDDAGGTDAGAVYLYNGATGELISTLSGSTDYDQLGAEGVLALANGNFVVNSPDWDNGTIVDAGAVTFGDGTTGVSGVISVSNSLIGSTDSDHVGGDGYVTALPNGNYVVISPDWDNGTVINAGAATFGNGSSGVTGMISAANSLVGTSDNDHVGGYNQVTVLTNGNYVVKSTYWDNGTITDAGAVTFGNGDTGVAGVVSAANSLVGSTDNDNVGGYSYGVSALTNGNYVVSSMNWDNGTIVDAGAVTFVDGTTGMSGVISESNSLVGSTNYDYVGEYVTVLNNGNYVVSSGFWHNETIVDAGAVTFGDGTTGVKGLISESNSLIGTNDGDRVGYVTALTNGNYVVGSPGWDNGTVVDAGAVTFADGTTGVSGVVSGNNSLVGTTEDDGVGYDVFALANGNYVVASPYWSNETVVEAGAVTFGDGTTGISGVVSVANSLVGSSDHDFLGLSGVTALANGNYVVSSSYWDNGTVADAGAVTFGDGAVGISGTVSATNSLVGTTNNDNVGGLFNSVTALTNGNYVVNSSDWDNGMIVDAGAVTFGDGTRGVSGEISATNSLVGSTEYDYVGGRFQGVTPLTNGNYVISSSYWDNGTTTDAGAVTFGDGTTGISGEISATNSLIGSFQSDRVGESAIAAFPNGNYVVRSPSWDDGTITDAGAVTFGDGTTGVTGEISAVNSVIGTSGAATIPDIIQDEINNTFYAVFLNEGKVWSLSRGEELPSLTLDELSDVIVNENAAEQTVSLTGISASGSSSPPLRVTATSSNTSLIPGPVVNYTSPDDTGSLTFTPVSGQSGTVTITVTVEDGGLDGDLGTTADNNILQRTFDVTVTPVVNLDVRVVGSPTTVQSNGEVSVLPENQDWIQEWSSFWLEIWITTPDQVSQGIANVTLDLNYHTAYTSATEVQFGPGFTQNQSFNINDLSGSVEVLTAGTAQADLGVDTQMLFARIKFDALADDQVPLDLSGQSIGPYDLGFQIGSPQVKMGNGSTATSENASYTGPSIWANPYDLNDDDAINFRDLILFVSDYNSVPAESSSDYAWVSDFNQNNRVEFRDLILFVSNYGKRKDDNQNIYYPRNFPEAWNNQIIAGVQNDISRSVKPLVQDTADTMLDNAIVDVSPHLSQDEKTKLDHVKVEVVDLDKNTLGQSDSNTIYIDRDAAGFGWFVDPTPFDDEEFENDSDLTLIALPESDASGSIDLWTVITHEIGHILGYNHENDGLMEKSLLPGVRKDMNWESEADQYFSTLQDETDLIIF